MRVFAKGGNWGMAEFMLRCRGQDYDTRLRFHKEMNFNMIRNWIGMTTDEAFYDACDRNGMMVWDDFWLNSSRALPASLEVFRANAIEKIKQVRNHACVALWCGENESTPAPTLERLAAGGHPDLRRGRPPLPAPVQRRQRQRRRPVQQPGP